MATKEGTQFDDGSNLPLTSNLPPDGYTRWNELKRLVPLCRESIRQRELEGRFPRRIHLSQRCAVWQNRELLKWLADPVGYRA